MKMANGIKIRAVLIALFAFYIAPILPLTVITSAPNFFGAAEPIGQRIPLWQSAASLLLFWFWALAPVGSGYLAAKLAQQQPLLHGLVAGAVGGVLTVLWVQGIWFLSLPLPCLLPVAVCSEVGCGVVAVSSAATGSSKRLQNDRKTASDFCGV